MEIGELTAPTFAQLSRLSDEDVLLYVKAGHDDAMAVLFVRYHRLILSISRRILHDVGEAEDCTQSIFFEVFRCAGQFDPKRGTAKLWLLRYAYHRSINRRRYLRYREFYGEAGAADSTFPSHCQKEESPSVFASIEARKMLDDAFNDLTAAQRATLEMAYFEGLSLREIAEATGEPVGNVRHHYYRGLRRLRALMTGEKKSGKSDSIGREVIDAEA